MTWAMAGALAGLIVAGAQAATAAEPAATEQALQRGRMLFALDEGAWGSTDDLLRRVPKASLPAEGGWVAEPDGETLRFTYYAIKDGTRSAIYRAEMNGRNVVSAAVVAEGADSSLSPQAQRLAAAREAAIKALADKRPCAKAPFNVLSMPTEDADGTTAVYLLTPMTRTGSYPFGGHYMAAVNGEGEVVRQRAFTKSCLDIAEPGGRAPRGTPVAVVTHMLDETPTEIHVFMAARMAAPVVVVTQPGMAWVVSEEKIEGPEPLPTQGK